ncbi:hypothetical protein MRX96_001578 [Rhipicephalus microplus]
MNVRSEDRVWKSEASETTGHGGQRGMPKKSGRTSICGAVVTTLMTRHRERHKYIIPLPLPNEIDGREDRVCKKHRDWHKYIMPLPLPEEIDGPEDRVCKIVSSETAGHEGRRGLPKETGQTRQIWDHRHNITGRHREWYKYMIPPPLSDENDWLEDRVWESEASETTCHEGQWGLNKLGKAGKCGAAVPTLLTRRRERHKYIIPLLLLDEIDGLEDRVSKCEASETAGHGGQRGLPK